MFAIARSFGRSLLRVAILLFVVVAMVIPSQANATPGGPTPPLDAEDQSGAQSVESGDPSVESGAQSVESGDPSVESGAQSVESEDPSKVASPDVQGDRATRTLSVKVNLPAGTNPQWLANAYATLLPVHSYSGVTNPSKKINPSTGHVTLKGVPSGKYYLVIDFRKDITLNGNWSPRTSALVYYPGTTFFHQEAQVIDLEPQPETNVAVNVPEIVIRAYYSYPNGVPSADGTGRWIQSVDDWIFTDNNWNARTGWHAIDGYWHWTTKHAIVARGWHFIGGNWYYFQQGTSRMHTGWHREDNGTWFYLRSNGVMATGWTPIGGYWYYLYSTGAMATGWVQIGSTWYYFHGSGAMATGWVQIGSTWYYFSPSGAWLY